MPLVAVVAAVGLEVGPVYRPGQLGGREGLGAGPVGDLRATLAGDVAVPGTGAAGGRGPASSLRHGSEVTGWDLGPCERGEISYTLGGIKFVQ